MSARYSRLAALLLPLALAGCGTTKIDDGKVERLIQDNVTPRPMAVSCPSGVEAKKGRTFECRLGYGGGRRATVTVHIASDDGHVTFAPGDVKPAS